MGGATTATSASSTTSRPATWTPTVPLAGYAHLRHAAVALRDGSMVVGGGLDAGTIGRALRHARDRGRRAADQPARPPAPMARGRSRRPCPPGAVAFTRPLPRKLKLSRSTVKVKLRCTGGPCADKLVLKQWHTTLATGTFKAADGQTVTVSLKLKRKPRQAHDEREPRARAAEADAVRFSARC